MTLTADGVREVTRKGIEERDASASYKAEQRILERAGEGFSWVIFNFQTMRATKKFAGIFMEQGFRVRRRSFRSLMVRW